MSESDTWQPIPRDPRQSLVPHGLRVLLALEGYVVIGELVAGRTWRMDATPGVVTSYPSDKGPTHWRLLPPPPTE